MGFSTQAYSLIIDFPLELITSDEGSSNGQTFEVLDIDGTWISRQPNSDGIINIPIDTDHLATLPKICINGIVVEIDIYRLAENAENTARLNLCTLRFNSEDTMEIPLRSYSSHIDYFNIGNSSTVLSTNKDYYLPKDVQYRYNYANKDNEIILNADKAIDLPNLYEVTIKVQEPDGTPANDLNVRYHNNDMSGYISKVNGDTAIYVTQGLMEIEVYSSGVTYDKKTVDVNSPKTVTMTVPKSITFTCKVNGEDYVDYLNIIDCETDKGFHFDHASENRDYKVRFDPDKNYRVCTRASHREEYDDYGYVEGAIKFTDGMDLRIGTLTVQNEGAGLAFPFAPFGTSYYYFVFVGNTIRLAAVPVGKGEFQSWDINGKEYTDPIMDFKIKDDITVATAQFNSGIATRIQSKDSNVQPINVSIDGNYLILPNDIEASAAIYSIDGRLTKSLGVVGDRINIGDMPSGTYVLTLTNGGLRQSAQFVKQ